METSDLEWPDSTEGKISWPGDETDGLDSHRSNDDSFRISGQRGFSSGKSGGILKKVKGQSPGKSARKKSPRMDDSYLSEPTSSRSGAGSAGDLSLSDFLAEPKKRVYDNMDDLDDLVSPNNKRR